jgi:hypothetical protein
MPEACPSCFSASLLPASGSIDWPPPLLGMLTIEIPLLVVYFARSNASATPALLQYPFLFPDFLACHHRLFVDVYFDNVTLATRHAH